MTTTRFRCGALAAAAVFPAACSSSADDSPLTTGGVQGSSSDSVGEGSSDVDHDDETGSHGTDGAPEGESSDGESSSGGDEPPPSAGFPLCPDPLPADWIVCEDFEGDEDLSTIFFEYQDGDGSFVRGDGDAASGRRSMRTLHRAGVEAAGWLSMAIGRNPAVYGESPNAAAEGDFTSVYWRFRIKTQAGWPDAGLGHLTSASVFASAEWTQAMVARLRSDNDNVVLLADPLSCIEGDSVVCTGFEDVTRQKGLGPLVGATPLFSGASSGEWHCVEAHVTLNTPGAKDGVFEFWVDDALENGAYDLDWRGSWADYGINLVTLENLWPGGAPVDLERAIDDLVISTEPIGCE